MEEVLQVILQEIKEIKSKMATKDDIANMATKDDIANMATKEDIANMATKDDIAIIRLDITRIDKQLHDLPLMKQAILELLETTNRLEETTNRLEQKTNRLEETTNRLEKTMVSKEDFNYIANKVFQLEREIMFLKK